MFIVTTGCTKWSLFKPKPTAPSLSVKSPDGTLVSASGDSPRAPEVSSKGSRTAFRVPEGSELRLDAITGLATFKLSKDTEVVSTANSTEVKGQNSFTPEKAPTIAEVKTETRKDWLYVACFAGIAAAIFGLVEKWQMVMIGGAVVASAAFVGLFVINHPVITYIIVGGAAFAFAGPYIWHLGGVKEMVAKMEGKTNGPLP